MFSSWTCDHELMEIPLSCSPFSTPTEGVYSSPTALPRETARTEKSQNSASGKIPEASFCALLLCPLRRCPSGLDYLVFMAAAPQGARLVPGGRSSVTQKQSLTLRLSSATSKPARRKQQPIHRSWAGREQQRDRLRAAARLVLEAEAVTERVSRWSTTGGIALTRPCGRSGNRGSSKRL